MPERAIGVGNTNPEKAKKIPIFSDYHQPYVRGSTLNQRTLSSSDMLEMPHFVATNITNIAKKVVLYDFFKSLLF